MNLIFCISNLFVPATLTLLKKKKEKFIIYTDQEGIFKFFENLNFDHVDLYYNPEIILAKNLASILDLEKRKLKVLSDLQLYSCTQLYFFHNSFGNFENWLIRKLSKNSKVFHIPVFNELPGHPKMDLTGLKGKIISNLFFSFNSQPIWTGERSIFKMKDSFFRSVNAMQIQIKPDNEFIQKIIDQKFQFGKKNIVLLTGSVVELGRVEEQEYIKKINTLISAIGEHNILCKPHPRFPNRFGLEKNLEIIPSYIPANVLIKKFPTFIGYNSGLLSEACNENALSISLIEYFGITSLELKDKYQKYLKKNVHTGEIKFPKTLKELVTLKIK